LAIETSGHAALRENYFLDDGAYLVAKLLVEMARMHAKGLELTQHIEKLEHAFEGKEFRLNILEEDFATYGKQILTDLMQITAKTEGWEVVEPNYEGLRVRCNNADEEGWFLLRMSLHDPVMPLNIESQIEGGVSNIKQKIKQMLMLYKGLDVGALKD
jgi:phosphomannomutase